MSKEIERKYLVVGDAWMDSTAFAHYRQGYIGTDVDRSVRVRVVGDRAFLTLKGPRIGMTRAEFEYEVPVRDANEILDSLCTKPLIEKTRFKVTHGDRIWEVDKFRGKNHGLVMAEIELRHPGEQVDLPSWVGCEVSDDPRFYNAYLAQHPYTQWPSTSKEAVPYQGANGLAAE